MKKDLIHLGVTTSFDSTEKLMERGNSDPIIPANTRFSIDAKIPSVAFIDADLMNYFLENFIACIRIECDHDSESSKLRVG